MDTWSAEIWRHGLTGILIDTNLLLLYAVGLCNPGLLARFKRTNQYTPDDFQLVREAAEGFPRLVTTPHILAEVSNLAIDRGTSGRPHVAFLVGVLQAAHEVYIHKDDILGSDVFGRFGATDAGIIDLAKRERYLVLTDDFAVAGYLRSAGRFALNLNDLRRRGGFGS